LVSFLIFSASSRIVVSLGLPITHVAETPRLASVSINCYVLIIDGRRIYNTEEFSKKLDYVAIGLGQSGALKFSFPTNLPGN
jgi:hypothetical protein